MRIANNAELLPVGTVAEYVYDVFGAVGSWSMAREVASVERQLEKMDGVKYLAHSYPDAEKGLNEIAFRVKIVEKTGPDDQLQRARVGVFAYAVTAAIVAGLVFTTMTVREIRIISEGNPDGPVAQIAGATGKVATFGTIAVVAGVIWFLLKK